MAPSGEGADSEETIRQSHYNWWDRRSLPRFSHFSGLPLVGGLFECPVAILPLACFRQRASCLLRPARAGT